MAEGQEDRSTEDLSDEASPFRVEEYRLKGQVAQSKELTSVLVFLAVATTLYLMTPQMANSLAILMKELFEVNAISKQDFSQPQVMGDVLVRVGKVALMMGLPICLAGFIMGVVGAFGQVGSVFSTDPITPDLNKLDPLSGLQRIFSMNTVIEGIKIFFKVMTVLIIAYSIFKTEVFRAGSYVGVEFSEQIGLYGAIAKSMVTSLALVMIIFALIDFGYQRWNFGKSVRLTKQEAKQEYKEREGDPMIKARIRAIQREMARKRMMNAVKKADVIVTNPTHIAIAIAYQKDNFMAPKVVAKGVDHLAQRIKKLAAESDIPIVENVPLARTLYKTVKVGQYVPRALYQAVAEVLAYVYRLKNRRF